MRQLSGVFGSGIALSAALLAGACQHDSTADFDDTHLSSGGSGATSSGGSTAEPGAGGESDGGSPSSGGGSSSMAGSSAMGGKSGSGAGGTGAGGKGGGTAGKGGQAAGGSEPGGTHGGGNAGKGGTEAAGTGGTNPIPDPEPVTIQIHELEDTTISSCDQNENFGNQNILQTDGDLCRFDALINPSLTAIPAGATVSKATLSLLCVNPGGVVTISFATGKKWTESMVRWSTKPEVGELIEDVSCQKDGDVVSIDLTDAVKAWLAGTSEADGIFLRTVDTDGTDFASSEAGKEADRPVLEVTYTPAIK